MARAIPRSHHRTSDSKGLIAVRASDLPATAPVKPEKERLRTFLLGQPPAIIYAVMTVMYLGRGDYGSELDFLERYTQLSDVARKPEWGVNQMVNKIPLADYLERGMKLAAAIGIAVDDLLQG
jgi:hypothetical protein